MNKSHGGAAESKQRDPATDPVLQFLGELSRQAAIELGDVDTLISYVTAHVADLIDADNLGLWFFDDTGKTLHSPRRFNIREGKPCAPIVTPPSRTGSGFNTPRTSPLMAVDDALNDPRTSDFRDAFIIPQGIGSLLEHAIRASGGDVGILSFERCGAPRPWQPNEIALARGISSYLSLAYVNRERRHVEGALRKSEARLLALADNLPGAVYHRPADISAPFSYISSGVSRFTGDNPVTAGSPDALGWASFVHPSDVQQVSSAYLKASDGGEYALEYRLRHPSGEEMWVLDRGRKSSQPDDAAMLDGVLFNITPRKRAEQAAQSAAALQGAILNNVAYAVVATDAKGTITFFNRAAEELLGYTAQELVGRQTPLIFHDLGEVQAHMLSAQKKLGREILYPFEIFTVDALGDSPSENEWTYIRKDGHRVSVRLSVTAIRSVDGEVTGFLSIASDISDRKTLATKLRQSEDIAAHVLLQSPDAILITSMQDGSILEANPGFEQITGIRQQDAIGRSTIELNIWSDLDERNAMIDAIRQSGEVTSLPIRINQRGGHVRHCVMWARAFAFNGGPALLSVVHDVTELRLAAQASRESEMMLQAVLDTVPSHVFWKDTHSRYLGCNRQFALDSGYSNPAEVVGLAEHDLLTGHTPEEIAETEAVLAADRHIISTGEPAPVRNAPFVMQDGVTHWVRVTKTALRNAAGEITGVLGVQHDVTEILESANVAQEAERMLQAVLDAIPSRVFWKDLNSVYLGCNLQFAKDSSANGDTDIVGKTDADLPWKSMAPTLRAADMRIVETGIPQLGLVKLYDMPSGPPRWFDVSKLPLINTDGEIKGILGIASDVTEQRMALEQLRANEEKLRSLFETSPLGVTLTSVDGRFLEANDAFLKIIGYDREALSELCYQHLSAPEYHEPDRHHVDVLAATGRHGPYEKEYIRKDGSRVAVSINGSMITDTDGNAYVWSTVEDITLRRAAEEARQKLNDELEHIVADRTVELKSAMEGLMRAEKLASLGSLVAGVAHEISTPVGNASLATSTMTGRIAEFEQVMAGKLTRATLDSFVQQIKLGTDIANRNIERVAALIQSFKQVAVDQTSSQRRQFHLTEIVDEIATTMHPSLKRSTVHLEMSVPGNIILDSYPGPLGQILTNLINNSLVHAFPDGRSGLIRIAAHQPDPHMLSLSIGDDGIGIPVSVQGRIFDPFFTSKLGRGGSGLGLHIVHSITTDILAGTILVTSEENHGTTFTLTIPLCSPTPQPNALQNDGSKP